MLALLVSLVLIVVWAVRSGNSGDGGGSDQGKERDGNRAASSITPGPSSSESLISERPGGREEVSGGTGGADGDTDGSQGAADSGGGGADGEGDGGADGGSGTGGANGANSGANGGANGANGGVSTGVSGGAVAVPADSGIPDCRPSSVEVTLRSVENRYAPGEEPTFRLTVRNSGNGACKVDFGSAATVFTITEAGDGDDRVWRSEDCAKGARSAFYRVPAGGTAVRTLEWDRRHSTPGCGTPGRAAAAGTYLVEAEVEGLKKVRTSFVLSKD